MRDDDATHAYIGVTKCGCTVAATVDAPYRGKHVSEDVKEFMDSGLTIERVTIEEARKRLKRCRCKEQPVPEAQQPLPL